MPPPVAVIDIGSNSIKVLIAARGSDGGVVTQYGQTIDARISSGISGAEPELSEEGMQRGLDAIRTLLAEAARFSPARVILVATSAVRDARNGADFCARIKGGTGHDVRVLSGDEEANLVGRGLTCDPALRDLNDFYVFDLGGGSLECLAFRQRKIEQAVSLQLGSVRLTEKFVPDPSKPLGRTPRYRVMQHVHDTFVRAPFKFSLPTDTPAIGTGGSMTTVRAMLGAPAGKSMEETDPFIPLTQLRLLLSSLARMALEERERVPGLPAARADIFPVALATMIVVANVGAFTGFRNSVYNLRYGVADEALGAS
jgi:exopolyphosphatase / guanosine-5'-triphosphate,3'-diphosphate pyrophosphatase